jgi:O-antigen/teichoic acid export membrane protein
MALRFIPQTLAIPLYPMYSRLAMNSETKDELHTAYDRSVKFFIVAGFPVAMLFFIFSGKMITLLLGEKYQVALPAMQLLGIAFLPFFVSSPFPFLLTALDEQRFLMVSSIFSLALRIGLNFALIPLYGYLGPCIAFFVSELVMLIIWAGKLSRLGFPLGLLKVTWRPLVASCCIGIALHFIQGASLLWLVPATCFSLVVYLLILVLLRTFSDSDLKLAKEGLSFLQPFLAKWSGQPATLK